MAYEDSDYAAFTAKADVSIPVNQDARFDISTMEIMPTEIPVGGQSNVMFSIYNTGKTILYNVQVKFEGDSISGGSCFVGKIDPGGTGNVDTMVEGVAATADDGMVKAVVTYEDESGNASTHEEMFTLYVYEESFDEEMMYEDFNMEEEGGKSHTGLIVGIVIILIIAAIVTTVILLKRRKRKKEQQELEEELLDDDVVLQDITDNAADITDESTLPQEQKVASKMQEVETKTDSESEE